MIEPGTGKRVGVRLLGCAAQVHGSVALRYRCSVTEIDLRVLGPVEVRVDGKLMNPGGRQQRALLAMLASDLDRVVPLDRIVDLLWAGEPPDQAVATLQTYVANLRRALEPRRAPRTPATVLLTQPPGYRLRVDAASLDAGRFEAAVSEAASAADSDPLRAYDLLTEALSWWTGPAYAEFADEVFAIGEANRLNELRLVAAEARFDLLLQLGHHRQTAGEIEQYAASNPFRERAYALHAVALYRSGRQAEALRAIDHARRMLLDDLGLDLGRDLQKLEAQILQQDPALDFRARQKTLPPENEAPGTATPPRVAAVSDQPKSSGSALPTAASPLVGRAAECATLDALLARSQAGFGQAVLVVGEPGAGKSVLAEYLTQRAIAGRGSASWTRCQPGAGLSFGVMRSIASIVEADLPEPVASMVADLMREMAASLPTIASGQERGPSEAQLRVLQGIEQLMRSDLPDNDATTAYAIVVDDLQWCDGPSLLALSAAAVPSLLHLRSRIVLVMTVRSTELDSSAELVDALERFHRSGVARIDVGPLSTEAIAELLAHHPGSTISAPSDGSLVAAAVRDRTGGNAYYASELVRLLRSENTLDVFDLEKVVPPSVSQVIRRRISRLPANTQQLLSMAAVAGTVFELSIVSDVLGISLDAALDQIEPAIISGLVVDDDPALGTMRFSHAITADSLVDTLPALRLASWHGRIADALSSRHGISRDVLPAIARHYTSAVVAGRGLEAAQAMQRLALDSATGRFFDDADRYLDEASAIIDSLPNGHQRDDLDGAVTLTRAMIAAWRGKWNDPMVSARLDRAARNFGERGYAEEQWSAMWVRAVFTVTSDDGAAARQLRDELRGLLAVETGPARHRLEAITNDVCAAVALFIDGDAERAIEAVRNAPRGPAWRSGSPPVVDAYVYKLVESRAPFFMALGSWLAGDQKTADDYVDELFELARRRHSAVYPNLGGRLMLLLLNDDHRRLRELLDAARISSEMTAGEELVTISRLWAEARQDPDSSVDGLYETYVNMQFNLIRVLHCIVAIAVATALVRGGQPEKALAVVQERLEHHDSAGVLAFTSELRRVESLALAARGDRAAALDAANDAVSRASRGNAPLLLERAEGALAHLQR
jgi:DNA-binding SARP family transcriptional activator